MSPRRQAEPPYDPQLIYPAREATSGRNLAGYFAKAASTLAALTQQLEDLPDLEADATETISREIGKALGQVHEARRLWVEYVTRQQYVTQRQLAEYLSAPNGSKVDPNFVSPGLIYSMRFNPLSEDDLTE